MKGIELDRMYITVRRRWRDGTMDDDTYMKCLVLLAHDWMAINEFDEALTVFACVTETYIRTGMQEQMKADPVFATAAYALAIRLNAGGIPDTEPPDPKMALLVALAKPASA